MLCKQDTSQAQEQARQSNTVPLASSDQHTASAAAYRGGKHTCGGESTDAAVGQGERSRLATHAQGSGGHRYRCTAPDSAPPAPACLPTWVGRIKSEQIPTNTDCAEPGSTSRLVMT